MGQPDTVVAGLDLGDAALADAVRDGLAAVESFIGESLMAGGALPAETSQHLLRAGGKRFRPLFTLLAAGVGVEDAAALSVQRRPDALVRAASVCEMIHLATLYHDDVMDEAPMRRGVDSANARWGNSVAILSGDYLFARASKVLADLGVEAVSVIADTFTQLVVGQLAETVGAEDRDPIEHYREVIDGKTASLVATAGLFGGRYGPAQGAHAEELARLGHHMGMAFQMVDDVIDISADPDQSGKVNGTDLREGVFTLPVLLALRDDAGPAGDRLREILTGPVTDDALVDEALALLRSSEGVGRAREVIDEEVVEARAILRSLPAGPAVDALDALIAYTVARVR